MHRRPRTARRFGLWLLLLPLVFVASWLTPPAAHAATPPQVTVPPIVTVIEGEVASVPVSINDVAHAYSTCFWPDCDSAVSISVFDPSGQRAGGEFWSNDWDTTYVSSALSTDIGIAYPVSGTYKMEVWTSQRHCCYTSRNGFTTQQVTFEVQVVPKPPAPKVSVKAKVVPEGAHNWKITGTVKIDGKPWQHKRVDIVAFAAAREVHLKSRRTNGRGKVVFRSSPEPGAAVFRVALRVQSGDDRVYSKRFRLPYRG